MHANVFLPQGSRQVRIFLNIYFFFRLVSGGTTQTESKTSCVYLTVLKIISYLRK